MEYPKEIDNLLCPQLDYVVKCWDALYDCGLEMAEQFRERYNYGHVDGLDTLHDYEDDWMIEEILSTYDIDPEKLWYLVLMAADYIEGMGFDIVFKKTPQQQLDKVFSLISSNLKEHPMPPMGYLFDNDPEMKLTLKVREKGKKRSTLVDIDTANALAILTNIYETADKSKFSQLMNVAVVDRSGICENPPNTAKLAGFTKIMMAFLKNCKAENGLGSRDVPKDKKYLISRLAHIVSLTPKGDKRYIDPKNPHFLENQIKGYEDVSIMSLNNFYHFDFYLY